MSPMVCLSLWMINVAYEDRYQPGTDHGLLKWKYPHMNSVDFELAWTRLPAFKRPKKTNGQVLEDEEAGAEGAEDDELELSERTGWGLFLANTKGTRGISNKRVLLQVRPHDVRQRSCRLRSAYATVCVKP